MVQVWCLRCRPRMCDCWIIIAPIELKLLTLYFVSISKQLKTWTRYSNDSYWRGACQPNQLLIYNIIEIHHKRDIVPSVYPLSWWQLTECDLLVEHKMLLKNVWKSSSDDCATKTSAQNPQRLIERKSREGPGPEIEGQYNTANEQTHLTSADLQGRCWNIYVHAWS